jgi:thiol:disulfide interchange protein
MLFAGLFLAAAQTTRLPKPAASNLSLYPSPRDAAADLKSALAQAASERKRVLAVVGANWCEDCQVLNTAFHSKELAPLVDGNYVVVHINVGDAGKENHDLAAHLGVPIEKGIPGLAVLDPNGKVVYAQKNGEFESADRIGMEDVRAFLEKWRPSR